MGEVTAPELKDRYYLGVFAHNCPQQEILNTEKVGASEVSLRQDHLRPRGGKKHPLTDPWGECHQRQMVWIHRHSHTQSQRLTPRVRAGA